MNIEICKLAPDLAEDYARFHDATPHQGEQGEIHCYCTAWHGENGEEAWFPAQEERRAKAIQFIKEGSLQGYLAYRGDEIVGWCNANTKADCAGCVDYLRSCELPVEDCAAGVKIKSIFCFLIAPKMQRKGVATQLIERVCKDAAKDGYDFVEAYGSKKPKGPAFEQFGYLAMYETCGFNQYAKRKDKIVMRKRLK